MKKTKTQKGITLVALIITIIVLLILAIVAIRAVQGDGILGKAKESTTKYEDSKIKEQEKLAEYGYLLAQSNGTTQANSIPEYFLEKYYPNLKIGDYVNYDEQSNGIKTYALDTTKGVGLTSGYNSETSQYEITSTGDVTTENLNWRVLGANSNGQLELISDKMTNQQIAIQGLNGYANSITILNEMSNKLYGLGTYASGARSLSSEDLMSLGGVIINDNSKISEGTLTKKSDGFIYCNGVKTEYTKFRYFDESSLEIKDLEVGSKPYIIKKEDYFIGRINDENVLELIKGGKETSLTLVAGKSTSVVEIGDGLGCRYYLACVDVSNYGTYITSGPNVGPSYMDTSSIRRNVDGLVKSFSIRPVVRLKAGLTVTKDATHDGSEVSKACVISNS